VYTAVYVPTPPAAMGSNWLPVMPGPLHIPPAGVAAGRVTKPGVLQNVALLTVSTGSGCTVMVRVSVLAQPLASVNV